MTGDTLNIWLSSSKPIAAVALAQLWEAGELDLDDPVALVVNGNPGELRHTERFQAVTEAIYEDLGLVCEAA